MPKWVSRGWDKPAKVFRHDREEEEEAEVEEVGGRYEAMVEEEGKGQRGSARLGISP